MVTVHRGVVFCMRDGSPSSHFVYAGHLSLKLFWHVSKLQTACRLLDLPFTLNLPLRWRTRQRTCPCTSQPLTLSRSSSCSHPKKLHLSQGTRLSSVTEHIDRLAVLNWSLDKKPYDPLKKPTALFWFRSVLCPDSRFGNDPLFLPGHFGH